jgi:2-methylcitrate dehydratase PrpD
LASGIDHLGNPFDLLSPGITFKQYPSCAETHTVLDAVIGLMNGNRIEPEEIESIACTVTPMDMDVLVYHRPRNSTEGKFSLEFCVALGVLERKATLSEFIDSRVKDPKILAIMDKIKMEADPKLSPDGYTGAAAVVCLRLKNGKILTKQVNQPKSDPSDPLTWDELLYKFRSRAALSLDKKKIERVIDHILFVERLKSIHPLMNLLCGHRMVHNISNQ